MEVQDIPALGSVPAIPRKESPTDSDCIASATATALPAQLKLYQNYTTFQNTPAVIVGGGGNVDAKQADRDTNLSGATGSLPSGYQLFWYEWRISIHTLTANLNTPGTAYAFEALNRIRRLGAAKYLQTGGNPLVTCGLLDLVSYIDSMSVSTTVDETTVIAPQIGFRGGKTMTVAEYRPLAA